MSDIVRRQVLALCGGAAVIVVILFIDYRHFERFALALYLGSIALLITTLAVAEVTRGAQAWLFGGRFQPSELAKIGMVLMLARYFHRNPPSQLSRVTDLAPPLVIAAIPVGLIVLQKDTIACTNPAPKRYAPRSIPTQRSQAIWKTNCIRCRSTISQDL